MIRVVAAGAMLLFVGFAACGESSSHLFLGQQYEPARGCLDPSSGIDVIEGSDPGLSCALKCLVAPPDEDGGRIVYASTACPPYPPLFDTSGLLTNCDQALAAFQREDTCLDDGGSTDPAPPDAGIDANTGVDAGNTVDAALDAPGG